MSNSSRTDLLLVLDSFRAFTIQESAQAFQLFLEISFNFHQKTQNVTKELPFLCTLVCKRLQWLKGNITFVSSILAAISYLWTAQNFATEFTTEEGLHLSPPKWRTFTFFFTFLIQLNGFQILHKFRFIITIHSMNKVFEEKTIQRKCYTDKQKPENIN